LENILPPSSGSKGKTSKKPAKSRQQAEPNDMLSGKSTRMFQRNALFPSSGWKRKPSKKPARSRWQAELCLLVSSSEDGVSAFPKKAVDF
jgi:hypothetical protein